MEKIKGIDGLRGIAALLVFLMHSTVPGFMGGGIGVDIFFAISGFLITTTFIKGGNDLIKFWFYRAFRIYPALVSMAFVSVFVFWKFKNFSNLDLANNFFPTITGVSNFARIIIGAPTFLGHTWSIGVEEQFYFIYPVLLILILKVSQKYVSIVIIFLAVLIVIYRFYLFKYLNVDIGDIANRTDTRIDGLLWGGALVFISRRSMEIISKFWLVAFIFLAMAANYERWYQPWLYKGGFSLLSIASCIILAKLNINNESILTKILEFYPLKKIGEMSYGFYLWHFPVIALFSDMITNVPVYNVSILFLITFTLAFVSYHYFEKSILNKRSLFFLNWPMKYKWIVIAWLPVSFLLGTGYIYYIQKNLWKLKDLIAL